MNQRIIPEDIQVVELGRGCPNKCDYCYEKQDPRLHDAIPKIEKNKIKLVDMNILSYPEPYKLLTELGDTKRYYELVCGIDWRLLDLPTACLLRKYRFGRFDRKGKWSRYIRFAWDYGYNLQYKMRDILDMLLTAGFKQNQIGVFILVNWKIPYEECLMKLDTLKYWGVQIHDCCYDGGYPKSEGDMTPGFWSFEQIKSFRKQCRKHNQKVTRRGLDPEYGSQD